MKDNNKALIFAGIATLSWSTVASAFKIALQYFSHYEMLLVASVTALLIFVLVLTFQKKWNLLQTLSRKDWVRFSWMGLLNPVIYYLVLFGAYDLLPAQIAQPINYFWPIVLLILISVISHKPIPKAKYIGMFMSLAGVTVISFSSGQISGSSFPLTGLLLGFFSAFLWAGFWLVNNMNKDKDFVLSLFMIFLFGSIYLGLGSIFMDVNLHSLPGMLSAVYIGAFEMGVPFVFFGLALRKSSNTALVNQLCYLSPFISLFIISLVLGEKILPTTLAGLFLIVFGIIFNEYLVKRK